LTDSSKLEFFESHALIGSLNRKRRRIIIRISIKVTIRKIPRKKSEKPKPAGSVS
jgi:hypothetical protein